jgi:predicted methyltransferase
MARQIARHLGSVSSAIAVVLLSSTSGAFAADPKVPAAVSAAVADAGRPDTDKSRDAGRKPAESVAFAGIKKGDKVVDLLPGGGYYTRIFSKVVGDSGVVYAVPFPPRPNAPAGAPNPLATLAADPAYKNIKIENTPPSDFKLPEPVDVVWTSLNYHDIHNQPADVVAAFNKAAFNALKPGGTYIVIDHAAAAGSGARDTSTLHRIDSEVVKTEVEAAGFKLDGQGDFLKNAADPHTANVHEEGALRWHTDQFILKFSKPKK